MKNLIGVLLSGSCMIVGFVGCGAVGPVVAPEDIGIEKKLREDQQNVKAQSQGPRLIPLEDNEVELPPLRPVGAR